VSVAAQHQTRYIVSIVKARVAGFIPLICLAFLLSSCHHSRPVATKRYPFTGRTISTDSQAQSALIDGDLVQGYMESMPMTYKFKPAETYRQLSSGDSISAELVVVQYDPRDERADSEYWLENVKVTAHAPSPPANVANSYHMPAIGEGVPDFSFSNQDGKHISFSQYRGTVLLVTFIYARCPFPDFCPRMSSNFAEIYKQMPTNPSLKNAHLLTISFDPGHDTPKVLRDYGFSVAHTKDASLFKSWEFVVAKSEDLPKIADFFALTIKPESGLITHNLSTAVIGPDGKIVKWYHGGDWQVSDLIKDAAAAQAAKH